MGIPEEPPRKHVLSQPKGWPPIPADLEKEMLAQRPTHSVHISPALGIPYVLVGPETQRTPRVKWHITVVDNDYATCLKMAQHALELDCMVLLEKAGGGGQPGNAFMSSPCVSYGDMSSLPAEQRFYPSPWGKMEDFRPYKYLTEWSNYCISKKWGIYTLALLLEHWYQIFDHIGYDGKVFIKPDDGHKCGGIFSGQILNVGDKAKFEDEITNGIPRAKTMIVARPVDIHKEWRLLIHRGNVVTGSQYWHDGKREVVSEFPDIVRCFFHNGLEKLWQPAPIYVLDVAARHVPGGGLQYGVVEIGQVNCAHMYGMHLNKVVAAMTEEARNHYLESNGVQPDRSPRPGYCDG